MPDSERTLVNEPGYLSAVLVTVPSGMTLVEYRSVIVKTFGELYAPVLEFLASHCSAVLHSETVRDISMKRRRAIQTVTRLWEACPGEQTHTCVCLPAPREESDGGIVTAAGDLPVG